MHMSNTGNEAALNNTARGTKFGSYYKLKVGASSHVTVKCRLVHSDECQPIDFKHEFDDVIESRERGTERFYKQVRR